MDSDAVKGSVLNGVSTGPRKSDWVRFDEDQVRREIVRTNATRYLLTGRVEHTDGFVRLRLRLYERESDTARWEGNFEGTTNDVIALERGGLEQVARALDRDIDDEARRRIDQVLAHNLEAYRWFLLGRGHHETGTRVDLRRALDCFDRALTLDRKYVTAHVGYMRVQREYYVTRPPTEVWPVLADRAQTILEIDDTCFVARYRLANKRLQYDFDWEGSMAEHERLIELWPEHNLAWTVYYRILGRTNESRVYHERLKQEPELDLYKLQHLAFGESVWRNHDEAIRIARQTVELAPDKPAWGQYNLGRCLRVAGRHREAIDALLASTTVWPGSRNANAPTRGTRTTWPGTTYATIRASRRSASGSAWAKTSGRSEGGAEEWWALISAHPLEKLNRRQHANAEGLAQGQKMASTTCPR